MDNKVIFIQVPDDTTVEQHEGILHALKKAELPYTFVIVPASYHAMEADEVRHLLDGLLSKLID